MDNNFEAKIRLPKKPSRVNAGYTILYLKIELNNLKNIIDQSLLEPSRDLDKLLPLLEGALRLEEMTTLNRSAADAKWLEPFQKQFYGLVRDIEKLGSMMRYGKLARTAKEFESIGCPDDSSIQLTLVAIARRLSAIDGQLNSATQSDTPDNNAQASLDLNEHMVILSPSSHKFALPAQTELLDDGSGRHSNLRPENLDRIAGDVERLKDVVRWTHQRHHDFETRMRGTLKRVEDHLTMVEIKAAEFVKEPRNNSVSRLPANCRSELTVLKCVASKIEEKEVDLPTILRRLGGEDHDRPGPEVFWRASEPSNSVPRQGQRGVEIGSKRTSWGVLLFLVLLFPGIGLVVGWATSRETETESFVRIIRSALTGIMPTPTAKSHVHDISSATPSGRQTARKDMAAKRHGSDVQKSDDRSGPSMLEAVSRMPVRDEFQVMRYFVPLEITQKSLRDALMRGDRLAYFETGNRYLEGRGVETNFGKAVTWYRRAAESGLAIAQLKMGLFYEKGYGITRNHEVAKRWYKLAAEQGNIAAMRALASLLFLDKKPLNLEQSMYWRARAADFGDSESQYIIGWAARDGVGVPRALDRSYKWLSLAAIDGNKQASIDRDQLVSKLNSLELERAQKAIKIWKRKPLKSEVNSLTVPKEWLY